MKKIFAAALVLASVACRGADEGQVTGVQPQGLRYAEADKPFLPKKAPEARVAVDVRVLPGKNMPFVKAVVDGRECSLLFDTGATHTTFDTGFLKRELPDAKLEDVVLAGTTNVGGAPKLFHVGTLKIGGAEFGGFDAMALDIAHLTSGIGTKVDGVLGMNVIGRVPVLVSLGKGTVVFVPGAEDMGGFGAGIARIASQPFTVALAPTYRGKRFGVIVDSASSLTFLNRALGWPSSESRADIGAVQVNGSSSLAAERGKPGVLALGTDVGISPMLVDEPLSMIGADTLLLHDMLVEPMRVRFRRRASAEGAPAEGAGKRSAESQEKRSAESQGKRSAESQEKRSAE